MGVKHLRQGSKELAELQEYFGDAFQEVEGRQGKNLKQRVLDPVYDKLYGKVDEFSVRAADQASTLSETVARQTLLTDMKNTGVLSENPFPGAVLLKERIGAEEAGILGLDEYMQKDWWINPGNLSAMKNAFQAVRVDGKVLQRLQPFSNAFRWAALATDVSAHAT